jgi:hypothetical protein
VVQPNLWEEDKKMFLDWVQGKSDTFQDGDMVVTLRCSLRAQSTDIDSTRQLKCLDITDVRVSYECQGEGIFRTWLEGTEEYVRGHPTFDALYVADVLTEQFASFFDRRSGYTLVGHGVGLRGERFPCFIWVP